MSERTNRTIAYALSRPMAYAVVVVTFAAIIVAIVGKWPVWVIGVSLAAGVLLLGLVVLDSLWDPAAERDASLADIDLGRVHDPVFREKVRRAVEYVRACQKLGRHQADGLVTAVEELPQLEQAARSVYQMSLRLQDFRADRLIKQDLDGLRQRQRLSHGALPEDEKEHLAALERLGEVAGNAEKEIDNALAHLGRSYAEMQAIKVTPELRGRAEDALRELGDSAARLSELATGYDEAYGGRAIADAPKDTGVAS